MTAIAQAPAATAQQRIFAAILVGVSLAAFAVIAPLATIQLAEVKAFIPAYQGALVTNDLITAALLLGQFGYFRSRAMLVLASGYFFTAAMALMHTLSFPGLFSPTGLLGAGVQTTAWLYTFWHAGFPLCVIAYKVLDVRDRRLGRAAAGMPEARACAAALAAIVTLATLLATAGSGALPDVMIGHRVAPTMTYVGGAVWGLSVAALLVVWQGRSSALDMWLAVVMLAWVLDIGLSLMLNAGRFDLGFYAGRIYGLVAATLVLAALLVENARVYMNLREHNQDLETARRAALEAERAKGAFVASMSHEIRTPMNGVLGMLELLALTPLSGEQKTSVEVIRQSGRSLMRILDDVLDYSKMVAGKLDLRPEATDLRTLLDTACRVFSGNAQSKGISLKWNVDPRLARSHLADGLRLQQVLQNLVSNAVKFTQVGGVQVDATSLERGEQSERIRITVEDTGPGIRPEDEERIFRAFSQGGGTRAGGTGLGLSISRRLAGLMGGTLEARSEPGIGTTMVLELRLDIARDAPMSAPAATAKPKAVQAPAEARQGIGRRILVVDDHPVNRMVMTRQLSVLGYTVDSAPTGAEALEKWRAGGISAVVTDCHMPVMDGHELTRRIRAMESGVSPSRVPIIACSANVLEGEATRCLESGMDDYLAKPASLEQLARKLERWLPGAGGDAPEPISDDDVMTEFWRYNDQDIADLRDAMGFDDPQAAYRAAHRIRGAAAAVGAAELAAICARIEGAARLSQWDRIREDFTLLEGETRRLHKQRAAAPEAP